MGQVYERLLSSATEPSSPVCPPEKGAAPRPWCARVRNEGAASTLPPTRVA